jgi:hypothetical protein
MSFAYDDADKLEKLPAVGTKQCVALIKQYTKAPAASLWKEGDRVRGRVTLKEGTAIATFIDGRYPNHGSGNHAAFYISQDAAGILVIDQWTRSGTIQKRRLAFKGKDRNGKFLDPSNNGDAFSVIE